VARRVWLRLRKAVRKDVIEQEEPGDAALHARLEVLRERCLIIIAAAAAALGTTLDVLDDGIAESPEVDAVEYRVEKVVRELGVLDGEDGCVLDRLDAVRLWARCRALLGHRYIGATEIK
jgi:hypothetical protein